VFRARECAGARDGTTAKGSRREQSGNKRWSGYTGETLADLMSSLTVTQITDSLLAVPAFLPATLCTGYLAAWFSNLHNFRQRSLVERIFWSVPLSLAVSPIAAVLITRFISLTAAVVFFFASAGMWAVIVAREWMQLRRAGKRWNTAWRPGGPAALVWALAWTAVALLSLTDFVSGHRLFLSATVLDFGARINWAAAILRTGVPPTNPMYWYGQAAHLRQYYFWYVVCAAVTRMYPLPLRSVYMASCVWSGFGLAALLGLYLKHFLEAGTRLRRQYLICIGLLAVTGLDIVAVIGEAMVLHLPLPLDFEWWSLDQITSWMDSLLWVPHHIASLLCCMFAFFLAWVAGRAEGRPRAAPIVFIACAIASAFGLSVYVTFAFFLLMLAWAVWQLLVERTPRPVWVLAMGGALSLVLLLPYLLELTHSASPGQGPGGRIFALGVREMIPPESLLSTARFAHLAAVHPVGARNLANLILLAPGYALELGFYLMVLLIFLIPAWRERTVLTSAQRALVFLALAMFPILSFLRSALIQNNDFGWRAALLLQFPLLLLGSELMMQWRLSPRRKVRDAPSETNAASLNSPKWLRSLTSLALFIGILSTVTQVLALRFDLPAVEAQKQAMHDADANRISHTAYISAAGYGELTARIPSDAVVQFDPAHANAILSVIDQLYVAHQAVITDNNGDCGSALGGDPRGCPIMSAALGALFNGTTADEARNTCRQFGIQYLVVTRYQPAWNDRGGWVWALPPVVSDEDFRALDCR
jgi:hypothetical protein